ncbi:MAG TPA: pyruvate ferredoxin oxidoreductase subunit gamma [Candidatus Bathyarchaeota archaeon]|nr:pyruvate ferredoxin oxidoreductase subunit gamma [Candidatus Bathyarchaeota archaeon]
MVLKEIRIHGRGGQGAVTAAQLIAEAAFREGKHSMAFPFFGAERRGAPVRAFARISDEPIYIRSQIYEPDIVLVLDPSLVGSPDVVEGLKEGGLLVLNTPKKPHELGLGKYKVATVDATGIAIELGLIVAGWPVVNTPMCGAFVAATGEVSLDTMLDVIKEHWPGSVGEKNAKAAILAYERLEKGW